MRAAFLTMLLVGCASEVEVCDGFDSCIALTVRPAGGEISIDELRLESVELEIAGKSSRAKNVVALPVQLAVVAPTHWAGGAFTLRVNGLNGGDSLGEDRLSGLLARGAHVSLTAFIGPDAPDRDADAVDLAAPVDLASADLAPPRGIFPANAGLEGVSANSLVVDPSNPDIVYVGTNGEGVFKSTDGSKSWKPANAGIDHETVSAMAVAPSAPSRLYAASSSSNKLFKSSDAGASWTPILDGAVVTIVVDPSDADKLFITLRPRGIDPGGVKLSVNGGKDFAAIQVGLAGLNDASALAMDPTNSNVLWCGGQMMADGFTGRALARSDNGGASWTRVTAANLTNHVSNPFRVVVDPKTPTTLYVAAGRTLMRSTDNGANFDFFTGGLMVDSFNQLTSGILDLGFTTDGTLELATGSGLFTLASGATTFQARSADPMERIAVAPSRPQRIYGVSNAATVASDDGGASFQVGVSGLTNLPVFAMRAAKGVLLAATARGVFRSTDAAATWNLIQLGRAVQLDLSTDGSQAWAVADGRLVHSSDGGKSFQPIASLSGSNLGQPLIDPIDPRRVYVLGLDTSSGTLKFKLWRSDDAGATFLDLSAGFPGVTDLSIDPSDSNILYAHPTERSPNRGASWNTLSPTFSPDRSGSDVGAVVIDPASPSTLYYCSSAHLYKSTDGGMTWSAQDNGLGEGDFPLLLRIATGGRLYMQAANHQSLLYRSDDGAASWHFIDSFPQISDIAVDPMDPDTLYIATGTGEGLFKSVTGGL